MSQSALLKLRQLMQQPDLPTLPEGVVFAEAGCPPLSDQVCDLLDAIQDGARNVFGGTQPSSAQLREMAQAGFPMLWEHGLIQTPQGLVRYKP